MTTRFIARYLRTSSGMVKNHYETLGITPTASQAEVKAAYYKKSMELHPDRVQGNRENFEEVASAYKILNDPSSRKSYDQSDGINIRRCDSRTKSGFKPFNKTSVYNVDQWTRQHYGETMKRDEIRRQYAQARDSSTKDYSKENVTFTIIFMILCTIGFTLVQKRHVKEKPDERPPSHN